MVNARKNWDILHCSEYWETKKFRIKLINSSLVLMQKRSKIEMKFWWHRHVTAQQCSMTGLILESQTQVPNTFLFNTEKNTSEQIIYSVVKEWKTDHLTVDYSPSHIRWAGALWSVFTHRLRSRHICFSSNTTVNEHERCSWYGSYCSFARLAFIWLIFLASCFQIRTDFPF
jgi:hypothetical protein